ncbi:NAD(P)H-dependent oxidoreductase [soil metagenome]
MTAPPNASPLIVGFGGTTRADSSSERLVRAVLAETERSGARTRMFDGPALEALPHFSPGDPARCDEQAAFVEAIRAADGIVIGSPGYHGGVSGLVKNAIDLIEDTRTDTRVYLDGLPVGLIVSAAGWQAGGVTLSSLRSIVHAMRGWPTPIGISVNTLSQTLFDASGQLVDEAVRAAVEGQARQIMRLAGG